MSAAEHFTQTTQKTFTGNRLVSQKLGSRSSQRRGFTVKAAFGGARSKASSQSYICKDCGYIYDERQNFESLDSSYRCPVCNAPKRRFTTYSAPVGRGANNLATRKERKQEMGLGGGLDAKIVLGIGAIIALGLVTYVSLSY